MSAKGYCYDNAFAESCFASLKSEMLEEGRPFDSKQAASTRALRLPGVLLQPQTPPQEPRLPLTGKLPKLYFQSQPTHLN